MTIEFALKENFPQKTLVNTPEIHRLWLSSVQQDFPAQQPINDKSFNSFNDNRITQEPVQ